MSFFALLSQAVLETVARVTRTGVRIDSRGKDAATAAVAAAAAAADPDPDSLPGLHGAASSEPEERAAELGADSGGIGGVGGLAADNGFGADVDPSDARAAALAVDILPMRGAALGIGAAAAAGGLADETSVGGAFHPRHGGGDGGVNASAYARDFHQEDAAKKAKHAAALGDGAGGGIGGSGMMTGGGAGVRAGYDDGGDDYAARRSVAPPPAPRDIMASLVAGAAQAASLALGDLAGGISGGEGGAEGEPEDVPRLIDAHDNVYVMSNPAAGDRMQLQQDAQLIADIVTVLVAAAVGGAAAAAMGQPSITGFLVAGACVGPGGAGLVAELVQVETFAQFGVILLLFCLGLEFSGTKLRAVRAVALAGGSAAMALLMFGAGVAAKLIGAPPGEGVFVGALVSMSSTAVVVKCLQERNALGTLHGQVTIGTLILQDCTIGLLFAMLPSLGDPERGAGAALAAATRVVAAAAAFAACAALAARHAVPRLLRWAAARGPELQQLTSLALCLALSKASDAAGLSLELGAFVAGVTIAAAEHGERTLHGIEPVRNVFAALFLASIGLLLNPWFLWTHRLALLSCLAVVVVCKAALTALVVRAFGYSARTALVVGMSLAQVGEFSFVLLARASTLKLVQRPAYLLLLGTTALSLLVTPLLFRAQPPLLRFAVAAGWLRAAPEDETAEAEAKADAKAADIEAEGGGPGGSPRLAGAAQGDEPGGAGDASGAALGSSAGAGLTSAVSRARASASLHHVAAQHRAQYGALMSPKGR